VSTLRKAQIAYVGAGLNAEEAAAPAVFPLPTLNSRVLIFAGGHSSSGVLNEWRATCNREGVNILDIDNPETAIPTLKEQIGAWT
jgi:poly-gamma-glutamate synthesis protein (capsule biosynthesis protein)